jgi:hypothetical protein
MKCKWIKYKWTLEIMKHHLLEENWFGEFKE